MAAQWVFTDARLPEYGECVKVTDGEKVSQGVLSSITNKWSFINCRLYNVIAWLYIPPDELPPHPTLYDCFYERE